jgi:predicted RNA-binding Zn-ribbon protein involved in translation (DUF1610 family)
MIDQYHIKCNCGKIFCIGTNIELPNNICAKHNCPNCGIEILTWIEKKNMERKRNRKPDWIYIPKSNLGQVKNTGCFVPSDYDWK